MGWVVIGAGASFAYTSKCRLTWGVSRLEGSFCGAFPEIVSLGIICKSEVPWTPSEGVKTTEQ